MQPLLLVTNPGYEEEAITRLSRVGFDNVSGYLKGGFSSWQAAGKEMDVVNRITPQQFAETARIGKDMILDIRKESEYDTAHIEGAHNRPLAYINDWIKDIDPEEHFFLHCAGGYRSMIAASVLQARGYRNFTEIEGGFNAIKNTNLPKTAPVCQAKTMQA